MSLVRSTSLLFSALLLLGGSGHALAKNSFVETDLASDLAGRAAHRDSLVVNPWGIVVGPGGRIFVADNETSVLTTYDLAGNPGSPVVTLPPMGEAAPTGMVLSRSGNSGEGRNGRDDGGDTGGPAFVIATESGTLVRWRPGRDGAMGVEVERDSDAVFKGIALDSDGSGPVYFVSDFHNARVEVFGANFHRLDWGSAFADSTVPAGYAPFGIANVGSMVVVTYAQQDADRHDDVQGPGFGYVNAFDHHGMLLRRLVSNGQLDAPWGIAVAPRGFGDFGGALLVGNFGDGIINAFDPGDGHFLGALADTSGHTLAIDGLWGLAFRTAGDGFGRSDNAVPSGDGSSDNGSPAGTLYFTAGLNDEADGLVGSISLAAPAVTSGEGDGRRGHRPLRVALQGVNPIRLAAQPTLSFGIERPGSGSVTLGIYDASGRLIAQPAKDFVLTDTGNVNWDGRDLRGARVPSGTYFYRVTDGAHFAGGRLVIVR